MNWTRRGAKILAAFFNGYAGGFTVSLPSNYILSPQNIQWDWVFFLPIISGLALTWPQIGKVFNEIAGTFESSKEKD